LTSENIRKVFGIDTIVNRHPITDSLYVIPISKPKDQQRRNLSVHLICGAGTGSTLMKILTDAGYNVPAGVLNLLDTDNETARLLGIPVASEAPLSPITDSAHRANLEMISKANAVVLTSIPFGYGNIRNLEAAKAALEKRIPTFVIDKVPAELRDFTNGAAKKKLVELKSKGAIFVADQNDLPSLLNISKDKMKMTKHLQTEIPGHLKTEPNSREREVVG
jgi:iron complex transport system ATP-binding protein